jgi:ABC-2 type transport system ATP-binding protein
MSEHTAVIEVRNLKKSYKKVDVLHDVSFTVRPGSVFALLGANGAGKTTTINILTTLLGADGGTAKVNGYEVRKRPAKVRESIGLTGQFAAVDDVLSAKENLVLIAELRHVPNPDKTAVQLLRDFDLADAADRKVATFSGGMRRRLDIAMSLIGNPKIIFFDEPTTGLDPQSRNAMWQKIKQLAASGTTIFLTTQYLEEADELADHIAVLVGGKIRAEGTPAQLKNLLPHGQVELSFSDVDTLKRAAKLFTTRHPALDETNLTLTIVTDGSIEAIADIASTIKRSGLIATGFTQKMPTLDDAFMKIINNYKEN